MEKFEIKLLIVDDIEANLISFKAILEKQDIEIFVANCGSEALKILMKEEIDIVLLDVQMPDINGFEVAQLMRDNPRTVSIPIIFITAINKEEQYMFKGYELGAVDYLYKPISNELLRNKVKVFTKLQLQAKIIAAKSKELENKIRELERVEKELYQITRTDQLTNITNRRGFDEIIDLIWRRSVRNKTPLTLLMIDIDNFKNYNDTYGHLKGDECLKKVAMMISKTLLRPYDLAARFGGEEFVVLLPETDITGGKRVAETIRTNIESMKIENEINGSPGLLTVSIGIAEALPNTINEKKDLLQWADEAMYEAKNTGKNKSCSYKEIRSL